MAVRRRRSRAPLQKSGIKTRRIKWEPLKWCNETFLCIEIIVNDGDEAVDDNASNL